MKYLSKESNIKNNDLSNAMGVSGLGSGSRYS